MAPRTSSSAQKAAARAQKTPYDRTRISPQLKAVSLVPPSTSSPPEPAPASSPSTSTTCSHKRKPTIRDSYLKFCQAYPDITPRDDWDLLVLATDPSDANKVSSADFYAHSDSRLELIYSARGKLDGDRERIKQEMTRMMDEEGTFIGVKPSPGEEDVHIRPIPDSEHSLRMWGRGLEANYEYCLDFVHTSTGEPVNSPRGYELWAVPNARTPWLPTITSRLDSVEHSFGIAQKDILPGAEKFLLLEGTPCMLKRPGRRPVYFEVPVRTRVDNRDFDRLTFG